MIANDIRIAVVGTGYIAQTLITAIRAVPGLHITGICSADPQRARSIASAFSIPIVYADLDEALADIEVDVVYIANASAQHADVAIRSLESGKAVLCEKPFAINSVEAEKVIAVARRTNRLFMEAVTTPFLPAVHTVLAKVASGRLGPVRHLSASFGYSSARSSHAGCYAAVGGGVLLDRAIYVVTLARLVLGPIINTRAFVLRDADGIDIEASMLLTHADGATSQVTASLTSMLGNMMTISCTNGSASVGAPLLSAEKIMLEHLTVPTGLTIPGKGRRRLKESSLLRRAADLFRARKIRFFSYGSSPYIHELIHFRNLYRAGSIESNVLPMEVSLDVMRVLDLAREGSR